MLQCGRTPRLEIRPFDSGVGCYFTLSMAYCCRVLCCELKISKVKRSLYKVAGVTVHGAVRLHTRLNITNNQLK